MKISTSSATNQDASAIVTVCEANLAQNNCKKFSAEDFSKKGFLTGRIGEEDVLKMLSNPQFIFLTAKIDDQIVGYANGCALEISGEEGIVKNLEVKKLQGKNFYYKQIAKLPNFSGVGQALFVALENEVKKSGYQNIICKIVHQPFLNQRSIDFHRRNGFVEIAKIVEDGLEKGVYCSDLGGKGVS